MEDILDDDNRSTASFVSLLVMIVFLLCRFQLGDANTYAELLAAFLALENQRLAFGVFRLVEDDIMVALGTTDSLHDLVS